MRRGHNRHRTAQRGGRGLAVSDEYECDARGRREKTRRAQNAGSPRDATGPLQLGLAVTHPFSICGLVIAVSGEQRAGLLDTTIVLIYAPALRAALDLGLEPGGIRRSNLVIEVEIK